MLKKFLLKKMQKAPFDSLSVALFSFKKKKIEIVHSVEIAHKDSLIEENSLYFDLASLTKPFTLFGCYLFYPEFFDRQMMATLEHRAGIVSGGRLCLQSWKKQILSYPLQETSTVYSDYSALRTMLMLEERSLKEFKDLCKPFIERGPIHWCDLTQEQKLMSTQTGFRNHKIIQGEVHDDNAYLLKQFCSHAGLFGRMKDVLNIISLFFENGLQNVVFATMKERQKTQRFILGWDRVLDSELSLAGKMMTPFFTIGHLGFTGTSCWLDLKQERGHILLANATQHYWRDRGVLNEIRRGIGEFF